MRTVGEAAELAGVSADTLRHYDRIGLLKPLARSDSGYRLYGRAELLRLREILVWRRLGFPLAEIARLVDESGDDHLAALERQLELAMTQLGRFQELVHGLKTAITAVHDGRSISEPALFAGFARSLANEDEDAPMDARRAGNSLAARIAPLADGADDTSVADELVANAGRIVATDPIRLAESLIALGILPVGTGTYEDRFTERPGVLPWPPSIEPIVRERIRDVGYYGSDARRVSSLHPEVILDLTAPWLDRPDGSLTESVSGGRYSYKKLGTIAPTALLDYEPNLIGRGTPGQLPAFRHFLMEIATLAGRVELAERLLATWEARVLVLRRHVAGKQVAMLATWGEGSIWGDGFYTPTANHLSQVFVPLGLRTLAPTEAQPISTLYSAPITNALGFGIEHVSELEADTLFVHTRHLSRAHIREIMRSTRIARLPAVRQGRIFELGWDFVNSGWFSANWQLGLVGHAFGVTQLRAGNDRDEVVMAADPGSGTLTLTATCRALSAEISGPTVVPTRVELRVGETAQIRLDTESIRALCRLPETFVLSLADGEHAIPFVRDRESALARVWKGSASARATSACPPSNRARPLRTIPVFGAELHS